MEEGILARYRWILVVIALVLIVLVLMSLAGVNVFRLGERAGSEKPEERLFWKRYDPLVPLRVTYAELGPDSPFERYTMVIDMLWVNTRDENFAAVYRHILHRGSGEGADFLQRAQQQRIEMQGSEAPTTGPTEQDILARMPQGLPIRMNPGILADPFSNDMLIFIDTERDNKNYRESLRLADIPMDQPFRLAILVMPNMIEVYINCQLEVTKIIDGTPRKIEEGWYGLVGPKPLNCMIQNLRIFKGILSPADLRGYCGSSSNLPEFPDVPACNK